MAVCSVVVSIGALGESAGESFSTPRCGLPGDPDRPVLCRQIVTLTYPHIGNTGVNGEDEDPTGSGPAPRHPRPPLAASSFRCEQTLSDYLDERGVVGIAENRHPPPDAPGCGEKGAQTGCIMAARSTRRARWIGACLSGPEGPGPGAGGQHQRALFLDEGSWVAGAGTPARPATRFKVVAYDYGVKRNILAHLVDRVALSPSCPRRRRPRP